MNCDRVSGYVLASWVSIRGARKQFTIDIYSHIIYGTNCHLVAWRNNTHLTRLNGDGLVIEYPPHLGRISTSPRLPGPRTRICRHRRRNQQHRWHNQQHNTDEEKLMPVHINLPSFGSRLFIPIRTQFVRHPTCIQALADAGLFSIAIPVRML